MEYRQNIILESIGISDFIVGATENVLYLFSLFLMRKFELVHEVEIYKEIMDILYKESLLEDEFHDTLNDIATLNHLFPDEDIFTKYSQEVMARIKQVELNAMVAMPYIVLLDDNTVCLEIRGIR